MTAAELVVEIGDIHRFATPDKLARFAGVGSGNKSRNYKSKQGNRAANMEQKPIKYSEECS